jgi:hypothetical protein
MTLDKKLKEDRMKQTLQGDVEHAGGKLIGVAEKSDHFSVTYNVDGEQFTSMVSKNPQHNVISAGICLLGNDKKFTLKNLITVVREAQQKHIVHRMWWRMHTFLIQTEKGEIQNDFAFGLLEAIRYQKWFRNEPLFKYDLIDGIYFFNKYSESIPIGSVEFSCAYMAWKKLPIPKPLNIPIELLDHKFTLRSVFNGTEKDIIGKKFVKSNDKIKAFTDIVSKAPIGNYQISSKGYL